MAMVLLLILVEGDPAWLDAVIYATVAVTVLSGADYFFGLRRLLHEGTHPRAKAPVPPR